MRKCAQSAAVTVDVLTEFWPLFTQSSPSWLHIGALACLNPPGPTSHRLVVSLAWVTCNRQFVGSLSVRLRYRLLFPVVQRLAVRGLRCPFVIRFDIAGR